MWRGKKTILAVTSAPKAVIFDNRTATAKVFYQAS
jgi:hypothetical protein